MLIVGRRVESSNEICGAQKKTYNNEYAFVNYSTNREGIKDIHKILIYGGIVLVLNLVFEAILFRTHDAFMITAKEMNRFWICDFMSQQNKSDLEEK